MNMSKTEVVKTKNLLLTIVNVIEEARVDYYQHNSGYDRIDMMEKYAPGKVIDIDNNVLLLVELRYLLRFGSAFLDLFVDDVIQPDEMLRQHELEELAEKRWQLKHDTLAETIGGYSLSNPNHRPKEDWSKEELYYMPTEEWEQFESTTLNRLEVIADELSPDSVKEEVLMGLLELIGNMKFAPRRCSELPDIMT